MLDLAISEGANRKGERTILTNRGRTMRAPEWPQDCEFQLVGFAPTAKVCDVVWTEQLAQDIGMALKKISESRVLADKKPDWYHRLARYAKGATDANLVEKFIMRADPAQSE